MYYKNILNFSVYDFLSFCKKNHGYRFVGLITDEQITSLSSNTMLDHWELISNLGDRVFPDIDDCCYSDGDLDSYISIFGEENNISIVLPDSLSFKQYEVLLEVINQIKKYEEESGILIFKGDYDSFIKDAQTKIKDSSLKSFNSNEVLFGVTLNDFISKKESLVSSVLDNYEEDSFLFWSKWDLDDDVSKTI